MSGIEDLTLAILRQIREDIATTRSDLSARMDGMDRRFDAMDRRFDAIDQRFVGLEGSFNQRFDEMTRHLEGLAAQHRLLTRYVVNTVTEHERQLVELRARL